MTLLAQPSTRPTLAAMCMRWLVLIVITYGTVVSSIGLTRSHGLAAIVESHQSAPTAPEENHGHEHAVQEVDASGADERASGEHPHHAMDHSHDMAHYLPLTWGAASPQLPSWEVMVRPWIEMGQAYRLDRPPMG
ncbi:hypothetical protein [Rhodoferax sp. PAMC 29310]|jgi:hypothetical protein|uniref:hypothetical protein n=1 Tax=Rhodoferax sp. PAMC 29310 TaxID=2822760 RepID=UPI001B3323DE|nr:hypothetical protein [Rhodoferax sp. PAMC 29310]